MIKLMFILGLCIVWSLAQSNSVRLERISTEIRNINGGLEKAIYAAAAINSIVAGLKDIYDNGRQKTLVVKGVNPGEMNVTCFYGSYFFPVEQLRVYVKGLIGSAIAMDSSNGYTISGLNIEVAVRALFNNSGIYSEAFGGDVSLNTKVIITREGDVLEAEIPPVHRKESAGRYICELDSSFKDTAARKALETVSRFIELIAEQSYNLAICSPPGDRFGMTVLGEVSIEEFRKFEDRVDTSDAHQKISAAAISLDSVLKSWMAESLSFFVNHPTTSILCGRYGRTSQTEVKIVDVSGCTTNSKLDTTKYVVNGTNLTVKISLVKQNRNFSDYLGTTTVGLGFTVQFTRTSVVVAPRPSSEKRAVVTKWPISQRTVGQCLITEGQMESIIDTVSIYLNTFFGNIVKRAIDTYRQ